MVTLKKPVFYLRKNKRAHFQTWIFEIHIIQTNDNSWHENYKLQRYS